MKSQKYSFAVILILSAILLAGCTSFDFFAVSTGGSAGEGGAMRSIGTPANNSTVKLEAGRYRGGVTIGSNKVTLIGAGSGQTTIEGDLRISGNNCTISRLRIRGDVTITGNNADLTGAVIDGRVSSSGNNNRW